MLSLSNIPEGRQGTARPAGKAAIFAAGQGFVIAGE